MKNKTLKGLQTQFSSITSQITLTSSKIKTLNKEKKSLRNRCEQLKKEIENLKKQSDTIVSEHAIIQYLTRVKGIEIKEVEDQILTKEVRDLVEKLGDSGKYPNKDFQVVLKDNVVVTVIK